MIETFDLILLLVLLKSPILVFVYFKMNKRKVSNSIK